MLEPIEPTEPIQPQAQTAPRAAAARGFHAPSDTLPPRRAAVRPLAPPVRRWVA